MDKNMLIADAGSSKTDWRLLDSQGNITAKYTEGINPFYESESQIYSKIAKSVLPEIEGSEVLRIFYYGAGCTAEKANLVKRALQKHFKKASIEVCDDLLAVARACCKKEEGIACILGTGSNSCYYNGTEIVEHIPSLGFMLGDEGSGAILGKKLIVAYFKKALPTDIAHELNYRYSLKLEEVLERVYKQAFPNRYLAGFSKFISQNIKHSFIRALVKESFEEFVKLNVLKYEKAEFVKIHFVGSIAKNYEQILNEVLTENKLQIGIKLQSPIDELVKFHAD